MCVPAQPNTQILLKQPLNFQIMFETFLNFRDVFVASSIFFLKPITTYHLAGINKKISETKKENANTSQAPPTKRRQHVSGSKRS